MAKTSTTDTAIWKVAEPIPEEVAAKFPEYPRTIAQLLYNRGLTDDATAGAFLNPVYTKDLHSPRLLKDMDRAVGVINAAIAAGERIVVHGDYDADGVTSTAVVCEALEKLGAQVDSFVPSRYKEGYGVSEATLLRLRQEGADLVITVDCGISSARAVAAGRKAGLKVVVTDHHLPPKRLPDADAVINPHRPGDQYPNKALTGVGVAFKLAQALLHESKLSPERQEAVEKWLLDLVALGTVADVASLTGENRTLVKFGLVVLGKTRRPGLQALLKAAQCDPAAVTSSRIGYALAPRLNAAGRLGEAADALELLRTTDSPRAAALAADLNALNQRRQAVTTEALAQAKASLGPVTDERRILVVDGEWLGGIVGLVAGRLAQEYFRPALVIERGATVSKGSARSTAALNIVDALAAHRDYLTTYGGHAGAAGFSLPTAKLADFRKALERFGRERLTRDDLRPVVDIEAEIAPEELNFTLADFLERFEPFGIDNPEPVFLVRGFTPGNARTVGQDANHLKIEGRLPGGAPLSVIAFGMGDRLAEFRGGPLDLVGAPVSSTFNRTRRLEWHLRDFQSAR